MKQKRWVEREEERVNRLTSQEMRLKTFRKTLEKELLHLFSKMLLNLDLLQNSLDLIMITF